MMSNNLFIGPLTIPAPQKCDFCEAYVEVEMVRGTGPIGGMFQGCILQYCDKCISDAPHGLEHAEHYMMLPSRQHMCKVLPPSDIDSQE